MTEAEGQAWCGALESYHYPVDLSTFARQGGLTTEWFPPVVLNIGNREQTVNFEARFRKQARQQILLRTMPPDGDVDSEAKCAVSSDISCFHGSRALSYGRFPNCALGE
jgi:hypothetical protein